MSLSYQPRTIGEFYPVIYVFAPRQKYSKWRLTFTKHGWQKSRCQWFSTDTCYPKLSQAIGELGVQLQSDIGHQYKNPDTLALFQKKYIEYFI